MGFIDPAYEREFWQQRKSAEYRAAQLDKLLLQAAAKETEGQFLAAAELYDQAARTESFRDTGRKRASQMRQLAKNGGDYAALANR
jgi:hypothetical protein